MKWQIYWILMGQHAHFWLQNEVTAQSRFHCIPFTLRGMP